MLFSLTKTCCNWLLSTSLQARLAFVQGNQCPFSDAQHWKSCTFDARLFILSSFSAWPLTSLMTIFWSRCCCLCFSCAYLSWTFAGARPPSLLVGLLWPWWTPSPLLPSSSCAWPAFLSHFGGLLPCQSPGFLDLGFWFSLVCLPCFVLFLAPCPLGLVLVWFGLGPPLPLLCPFWGFGGCCPPIFILD